MIYAIDPGPLKCGTATWDINLGVVHDEMPLSVVIGTLQSSSGRLVVCEDVEFRGNRMGRDTIGTAKSIGCLQYVALRASHRFVTVRRSQAFNWLMGATPLEVTARVRTSDARVAAALRHHLGARPTGSHGAAAALLALYAHHNLKDR